LGGKRNSLKATINLQSRQEQASQSAAQCRVNVYYQFAVATEWATVFAKAENGDSL